MEASCQWPVCLLQVATCYHGSTMAQSFPKFMGVQQLESLTLLLGMQW